METWVVREVCANSEGDCRNETTCGRWKINCFATHLMVSFQYLGFIQLIGYILAHTQSHIHILHWLLGLTVQLWKKKCGISLRSVKVVFVHVDIEIHWIQVSGSSYDKVLRCSDTDLGGWTDVRSIRVCDDRERMVWGFFSLSLSFLPRWLIWYPLFSLSKLKSSAEPVTTASHKWGFVCLKQKSRVNTFKVSLLCNHLCAH